MKTTTVAFGVCLCLAALAAGQEDKDARMERDLRLVDIVRAMGLGEGKRAADLGAGSGDFEPWLSRAVGATGRIYAEDIVQAEVRALRKHVSARHLRNVDIILGTADDPKLPPGSLDAAVMMISYHEMKDYPKMLERVAVALKPGGRFVIVDMTPHKTMTRPREDQTRNHVLAPDLAESEVRQAGFEVISRDDRFIDWPDQEWARWIIVFQKPRDRT